MEKILRAALKRFADGGYAATSVQQIVDDAKVSSPRSIIILLDKARLFEALVHEAHDERYRVFAGIGGGQRKNFRAQGRKSESGEGSLIFSARNRELMRIAFATMFAAPGEA